MRIVGGKYRKLPLVAPKGNATRPTTDRTRESLFNILENRINFSDIRVLDLFAGTGALGLEAISRGACYCLFVEQATSARNAIHENIETLGVQEMTSIYRRDATCLGEMREIGKADDAQPFSLVLCDPPYSKKLGTKAAASLVCGNWLASEALFVLEENHVSFPDEITDFELLNQRRYGDTRIGIFRFTKNSPVTKS